MKKIMKKIRAVKKNEQGIAILFTLGILSLLLMLAVAFAANALIERKAAFNTNYTSMARLLAKSGMERAIAVMEFYRTTPAFSSYSYTNIITHDETTSNAETHDYLHHLESTVDGTTYYKWPTNYDKDDDGAVHWQYIDNGLTGADRRLIGRIAYVVTNKCGLDPSAVVDSGIVTGTAVNESVANEQRPGVNLTEINLKYLDPGEGTLTSTDVVKLSSTNSVSGTLTAGERWVDFETIFNSDHLNINSDAKKQQFRTWFALNNPPDPEAFWVDSNGDNLKESGELYGRFNLARADWDSLSVSDIVNTPVVLGSANADGDGLSWLLNWRNKGDFSSETDRANQIAANLIDYCDEDSTPTTGDSSGPITNLSNWDSSSCVPVYTGNEKTPYINEVGVKVNGSVSRTGTWFTGYTYTYSIDLTLQGEIINMYEEELNTSKMKIYGYYSYKYFDGYNGTQTVEREISGSIDFGTISAHSYLYATAACDSHSHTMSYGWGSSADITDVKVKITRVVLEYDTSDPADNSVDTNVDISFPTSAYSNDVDLFTNSSGTTKSGYFTYEVNDPRHNLHSSQWTGITPALTETGTFDDVNIAVPASSSKDTEAVVTGLDTGTYGTDQRIDVANLSTAYIRNGPMQSPWEIGAIHRGKAWETINLKEYNSANSGGNEYTESSSGAGDGGDANILDEIKMTSNKETYGKVNLNTTDTDVLRALFAYIWVHDNYDSPGSQSPASGELTGGTDATSGIAYTVASALISYINTNSAFKHRSELAKLVNISNNSLGLGQTNDAKKEAIIGKVINLTKADLVEEYTVIVIAQAIKDVGNGVVKKVDLNKDGDGDDSNVSVTGVYPTAENFDETRPAAAYGTYDIFVDEIIGEQKIIAIVKYDSTLSKFRIVRFEYLED